MVKPDAEAYENLLNENNLKPEECVYVDDQKKNVDVGKRIGMYGILFKDVERLKTELRTSGINLADLSDGLKIN